MSKEKMGKMNKRDKEREIGSGFEVENKNDHPANKDERGEKNSKIKKKIYEKELAKHFSPN